MKTLERASGARFIPRSSLRERAAAQGRERGGSQSTTARRNGIKATRTPRPGFQAPPPAQSAQGSIPARESAPHNSVRLARYTCGDRPA
jgi:hypothetical protein